MEHESPRAAAQGPDAIYSQMAQILHGIDRGELAPQELRFPMGIVTAGDFVRYLMSGHLTERQLNRWMERRQAALEVNPSDVVCNAVDQWRTHRTS